MRRAYWSADFGEAHVVAAMLRAQGVHASVFDAGIVRQDWFKTLALGGYRVMVPDAQTAAAQELLAAYRAGAMAVADVEVDVPSCPRCGGSDTRADPRPRRAVFGALIASQAAFFAFFYSAPLLWWIAGVMQCIPLAAARWLGPRYRCASCARAFAARRHPFAALARKVRDAEARTPQEAA